VGDSVKQPKEDCCILGVKRIAQESETQTEPGIYATSYGLCARLQLDFSNTAIKEKIKRLPLSLAGQPFKFIGFML